MIKFNPQTGIFVENAEQIRERLRNSWKKAFKTDPNLPELNTEPETPAGQLIDAQTALVMEKDDEILFLANQWNPATSNGIWQEGIGKIYFIDRKIAQPTHVTCEVTGLYGTIIPYGAIVQDVVGNTFQNTFPQMIGKTGQSAIIVRCTEWGPIEIGANTINKIITTIPGWDTIYNSNAGVTGRVEETPAEFENRRYESVAKNAHGAAAAVAGAVGNVNNVIAHRVLENTGCDWKREFQVDIAPHSLYISVYGGTDEDIARAIYLKIDGGCGTTGTTKLEYIPRPEENDQEGALYTYYIVRPDTVATGIDVVIRKTKDMPLNIVEDIKASIVENFNGMTENYTRVRMATTLYSSRFYNSVIGAGVKDLEKIQIRFPAPAAPKDSIEIPANKMPVLDQSDIVVTILEE